VAGDASAPLALWEEGRSPPLRFIYRALNSIKNRLAEKNLQVGARAACTARGMSQKNRGASMRDELLERQTEFSERPRFAAAAAEELLLGSRRLRLAFMRAPLRFAGRDTPLLSAGSAPSAAVLIRSGFAFRSCLLPDGRRAILSILLSGDMGGLHNIVLARSCEDIHAAGRVGYSTIGADTLRELLDDRCVMMNMMAQLAEARWRADRLAATIGRLDAHARLCVLLLDIHDRLRHRGLISRPTFNLPLTQEQIADHLGLTLVHVNRTLRRLREEKIVLVDRQVVIILDVEQLRQLAQGLPQAAEMPEPAIAFERGGIGEFPN
jgi:CRP-like cAMP-binding protein